MDSNYEGLSDPELYELLEKAHLAEKLESDPAWKLLKEAAKRIVDRAVTELALKTESDDFNKIAELRAIIKKYKFGLFDEIQILKTEAEQARRVSEDSGRIKSIFASIRKRFE